MPSETREFTVILSLQDDGGYSVVCPALPGCVSQGENQREALENIMEAAELVLEALDNEASAEDERSDGSSRMQLPHPETSDLIIDEIRCILADRDEDGLPYGGVSLERVELSVQGPNVNAAPSR